MTVEKSNFATSRKNVFVTLTNYTTKVVLVFLVIINTFVNWLITYLVNDDPANMTSWHRVSRASHGWLHNVYRTNGDIHQFVVATKNIIDNIVLDLLKKMVSAPGEKID